MIVDRVVHIVSCHAEGEVGDVIVGGIKPPVGKSIWEQRDSIADNGELRDFVLNEPRGGVFRHCNLLVPPVDPLADMGFIIMEPMYNPPMSGSNSMCVATVLLETGIVAMQEPITELILEAPGGLVPVTARCHNGKVESVTIQNLPSFVAETHKVLSVPGLGEISVSVAFGGDSFVIVDVEQIGLEILQENAKRIAELGETITQQANEQLKFEHPVLDSWRHISFCLFASPVTKKGTELFSKSAVVVSPGKVDRSPTGTAVCARMALLYEDNTMRLGDTLKASSIIDSQFSGSIVSETSVGNRRGIIPEVTGRAWITGTHQYRLDRTDPYPRGYRLSDTWPGAQ